MSALPSTRHTLIRLLQEDGPRATHAWDDLYRIYHPAVLDFCLRRGVQPADAEDVAQKVLLKLSTCIRSYRRVEGRRFRGWLFTVTSHVLCDERGRRKHREVPTDGEALNRLCQPDSVEELSAELDERWNPHVSPERLAAEAEAMLGPLLWDVFRRVDVLGDTPAQAALALGIERNNLYTRLHRARRMIRDLRVRLEAESEEG